MNTHNLKVDQEFKGLCLPLTSEEEENLRQSLLSEGCRDAIVAWEGHDIIVDGHNRFGICDAEEINFRVKYLKFADRNAVINWMIHNQLGRRNATEEQKSYLRGKLYREQKNQQGGDQRSKRHSAASIDTATVIASENGVDRRTVQRDATFSKAVDDLHAKSPELADAAKRGEIPKSAVADLVDASKSTLNQIAKLRGPERTKAARAAAKETKAANPPKPRGPAGGKTAKNGKPAVDVRMFKEFEQKVGKAIRMNSAVQHHCGVSEHHTRIRNLLNSVVEEIGAWRQSVTA